MVKRLLDKVREAFGVVGVGVDGSGCEVADSHVFGEPNGEVTRSFFMGSHMRFPSYILLKEPFTRCE